MCKCSLGQACNVDCESETRNFVIKLFGTTISVSASDGKADEFLQEQDACKRPAPPFETENLGERKGKSLKTEIILENSLKSQSSCERGEKSLKSLKFEEFSNGKSLRTENILEKSLKSQSSCDGGEKSLKSLKYEEFSNGKSEKASERAPPKPSKPVACPRCHSSETKFCYFNNYNVNQPRHFCKNCRRYWTAGGTMRNIPVGAGRRKSKHFTAFQLHSGSNSLDLQESEVKSENFEEPVNETRLFSFNDESTSVSSVTGVAGIDMKVPYLEEMDAAISDGFVNSLTVNGFSGAGFSNLMDPGLKIKAISTENSQWIPEIQQNGNSALLADCCVLYGKPMIPNCTLRPDE